MQGSGNNNPLARLSHDVYMYLYLCGACYAATPDHLIVLLPQLLGPLLSATHAGCEQRVDLIVVMSRGPGRAAGSETFNSDINNRAPP